MNDFDKINDLLDFYQELLTEKQQIIMEYYYRENYSLSEISDILAISKPAVADTVRRSNQLMNNYEEKLKLVTKFHQRQKIYQQLLTDYQLDEIVKELQSIE